MDTAKIGGMTGAKGHRIAVDCQCNNSMIIIDVKPLKGIMALGFACTDVIIPQYYVSMFKYIQMDRYESVRLYIDPGRS